MGEYERQNITISGPTNLFHSSQFGGDDSLFGLVIAASSRGLDVVDFPGEHSELTGVTDQSRFTPAIAAMLASAGLEVHDYPAYLQVDPEAEVDSNFPGRLDVDYNENGDPENSIARTWQQWAEFGGQSVTEVGGVHYVKLIDPADTNRPFLPASLWASFVTSGKVKSGFEMKGLKAEESPDE